MLKGLINAKKIQLKVEDIEVEGIGNSTHTNTLIFIIRSQEMLFN